MQIIFALCLQIQIYYVIIILRIGYKGLLMKVFYLKYFKDILKKISTVLVESTRTTKLGFFF